MISRQGEDIPHEVSITLLTGFRLKLSIVENFELYKSISILFSSSFILISFISSIVSIIPIENQKPTASSFKSRGRQTMFAKGSELIKISINFSIRIVSSVFSFSDFFILRIFSFRLNNIQNGLLVFFLLF